MDDRVRICIENLKPILRDQPGEHHTDLMFGALQALERLLQADRVQDPSVERLIPLLRKDANSLLHGSKKFLAALAQIEACLEASPPEPLPQPSTTLPHVYFLSYAQNDSDAADRIDRLLQDNRRLVWRDLRGLAPGDDHLEIIAAQVDACSTFVALHSNAYTGSDYCKGELARALTRLRSGPTPCRVALLRLDDTQVPLVYGTRSWDWARTIAEHTATVRRLLENEPPCTPIAAVSNRQT